MQDGQNLFEAETAAFRDWKIPLRMKNLPDSHQVIIVGIDNGEERRIDEYAPYSRGKQGGGEGELYMEFVIETIKEFVDYRYRTLPFRETTAIAGSSLGGLISLFAGLKYGEYFSGTIRKS
jgi:predicted alpha/beta superfamily hydrolase